MKQNINIKEVNGFLKNTHKSNLENIKSSLDKREWHWLLPEHWHNNQENRNLLSCAIDAVITIGIK